MKPWPLAVEHQKLEDVARELIQWDDELTAGGDVDDGRNLLADEARAALGIPRRYEELASEWERDS